MTRQSFAATGVVMLMWMAAGCGTPAPAQKVNAHLPKDVPVLDADPQACNKADTLVLAQCAQRLEYADIIKGDRVDIWYVTQWKVLDVGRGKWPYETVSFVFREERRMQKSGVLLEGSPIPYYVGAIMAFCIDTAGGKTTIAATHPDAGGPTYVLSYDNSTIIASQPRSRIPPHNPSQRPIYDMRDPNSNDLYGRITDAARVFVRQQVGATGAVNVSEEYGVLYVVEIKTEKDSWAVVVDRDSLAVKWADPTDAQK
jgi:hypothetical protein